MSRSAAKPSISRNRSASDVTKEIRFKAVKKRQDTLAAADAGLQQTPSEGWSLAVANAEKRLDAAKAALKAAQEGAFRRTVEFELEPKCDQEQTCTISVARCAPGGGGEHAVLRFLG
jgi:hypothetical protein